MHNTGRAQRKRGFGHMRTASAQCDQSLRCPLTESLDTKECINREQMPGTDFEHAWDE